MDYLLISNAKVIPENINSTITVVQSFLWQEAELRSSVSEALKSIIDQAIEVH